jgi:hypothetical protein
MKSNRRAFLQVAGSSFLGLSAGQAKSIESPKSVILVLLTGGASQLDSFDPKPDAPAEIRGEFGTIPTALPGARLCEHLPMLAARMRHWALVRSLSHGENGHLPGTHRLLTGSPMPVQRGTDLDNVLSRRDWPCYGAAVSHIRKSDSGVPAGVTLPHGLIEGSLTWPGQHAGFLGPAHDPLLVTQDPNRPDFRFDTLEPHAAVGAERLSERHALLGSISHATDARPHHETAFRMLGASQVARAFRVGSEPERTRDRYGRTSFGQTLLLARRLVQAGVSVVQANMGIVQSWDTHSDNWGRLKTRLLPWLDQGLAALIDDLADEGRLESTLVAVVGEFGRTPKVSNLPGQPKPGRDHWAACYSGLFAGAGVRGGQVIGKSDSKAAYPVTTAYTPYNIGATIYQVLGIDPHTEIVDSLSRPMAINRGKPMEILFRGA